MIKAKKLPPKRLEGRYGFLLNSVHRSLEFQVNEALAGTDISTRHLGVLDTLLSFKSPLSQKELCLETRKDRTSMGVIVSELEKLKLVTREVDKNDQRAYMVQLTPSGVERTNQGSEIAKKTQKKFMSKISLEKRELLLEILKELYSAHDVMKE